jgi:MFS family permease
MAAAWPERDENRPNIADWQGLNLLRVSYRAEEVAMTAPSPADSDGRRRLSLGFLNWAHALDHYVILIFPTVVIGLEAVYGRSYGELITLSTAAFTAFGLFALPSGWLADRFGRRNMIAVYFFGCGLSLIAVGLSSDFTVLAVALFAMGVFAAIYHPVGTPYIVDLAVNRGRTMAFNGVCGNMGAALAAGITAAIASWLGWRGAFLVPAAIFLVSGLAFVRYVPDDGRKPTPRSLAQDVALDRRVAIAVVTLFIVLALFSGLVFNAISIAVPKMVDERMGAAVPLFVTGSLATAVFLCGALAQLSMGRLVERVPPHFLVAGVAATQLIGVVWASYAEGWVLLLALAVAMSAIYGQFTVNDIVLARYCPATWRNRVYALRFFFIFTSAGPAVWGVGRMYEQGGFHLVLLVASVIAAAFVVTAFAIALLVNNVEARRARAAQPAE